jgi:hypothetical protein
MIFFVIDVMQIATTVLAAIGIIPGLWWVFYYCCLLLLQLFHEDIKFKKKQILAMCVFF